MTLREDQAERVAGTGTTARAGAPGRPPLAPHRRRLPSAADLAARQELYRGFGNGLALAFELAMVPILFGVGGWALDRWLGTAPVLMVVLGLVAVVGLFARAWCDYEQRMQELDAAGPWAKAAAGVARVPGPVASAPPPAPPPGPGSRPGASR